MRNAKLHPQFRVLLLVILALLLPQYGISQLLILQIGLLAACWYNNTVSDWLTAVLRLKWLFVSIFVLYGWFTPGLPVYEIRGVNMPTSEGLVQAFSRLLLLSVLVASVMWLVKPLAAPVLSQALSRLLAPLKFLTVDIEQLSKRLALTLAAVSDIQTLLAQSKSKGWLASAGTVIQIIEAGDLNGFEEKSAVAHWRVPNCRDYSLLGLLLVMIVLPLFMYSVVP